MYSSPVVCKMGFTLNGTRFPKFGHLAHMSLCMMGLYASGFLATQSKKKIGKIAQILANGPRIR